MSPKWYAPDYPYRGAAPNGSILLEWVEVFALYGTASTDRSSSRIFESMALDAMGTAPAMWPAAPDYLNRKFLKFGGGAPSPLQTRRSNALPIPLL